MHENRSAVARSKIGSGSPQVFFILCLGFLVGTGTRTIPLRAGSPDGTPRVVFTKEFPNSRPDYYSVIVYENGRALYKTAPDDPSPVEFQVPPEAAAEVFRLAEKLNWFKDRKLESGRRVANMGKKTLGYGKGDEISEAAFNHTEVPEALELASMFERISQTNEHLLRLKNMVRFDRLGVVKELLQIETDLDAGRLLGAGQLVPMLEQIRNDRSLVNVAKDRAVQILGKILSGKL
jgi:hypothetical protein